MSRRRRSVIVALAVTSVSAAAAVIVRRRHDGRRPHVGLYFEDGSMVALPESSPQAAPLVEIGREAVGVVRGT